AQTPGAKLRFSSAICAQRRGLAPDADTRSKAPFSSANLRPAQRGLRPAQMTATNLFFPF
ncbi:hypothetical protein A2U01_0114258, partial [Trifolium medium]|nr:hypothetical protein [Trifolium medium]